MILLKILIITVSVLTLLSLSVYIYLAAKGDSITLYSTINSNYLSIKQKIFLGFAAIGFLVSMYTGAEAMLFWMPSEWGSIDSDGEYQTVRSTISFVFALFGGLSLIQFIDKATHEKFFLRKLRDESHELERIVNASVDVYELKRIKKEYQKTVSELYENKKNSNQFFTPYKENIQRYNNLILKIDALCNKVNKLIANEIIVENKVKEDKQNYDKEKAAIAKRNKESDHKAQNYHNAINSIIKNNNFKVVNNIDDIDDNKYYLIDPPVIERKWKTLNAAANIVFTVDEKMITEGSSTPININSYFENNTNAGVIDKFKIMACYSGDSHGGHTKLYSVSGDSKGEYLLGIKVAETIEGLIEGFYIGLKLPTKGVYWHGLYGRDYEFLLNNDHFINVLCNKVSSPVTEVLDKIKLPSGIRIVKSSGSYKVSCLAAYPNGSIVDMSISITNGILNILPTINILDSEVNILY